MVFCFFFIFFCFLIFINSVLCICFNNMFMRLRWMLMSDWSSVFVFFFILSCVLMFCMLDLGRVFWIFMFWSNRFFFVFSVSMSVMIWVVDIGCLFFSGVDRLFFIWV